jgi:WD40 repeat protein
MCRVWSFPDLSKVHEFTTHEKEVDDVDFSPDSAKICSISKDRYIHVGLFLEVGTLVGWGGGAKREEIRQIGKLKEGSPCPLSSKLVSYGWMTMHS